MPDCKACGKWFATMEQCELCPTCERALERLSNYAAPVVRCRDCKHFREYITVGTVCTKYVKSLGGREVGLRATGKNDFCSYGERKDGDTDGS